MTTNHLFKHLLPSLQEWVGGRLLLGLLFVLFGIITASAAEPEYDFTATTAQGQTFYYSIETDANNPDRKIVAVTNGQHNDGIFGHFDANPYDDYGDIVIPSTVTHNGVTYTVAALRYTFAKAYHVSSITLPNTIEHISQWAFTGCRALQSVTIPESVTGIGHEAISDFGGIEGYQFNNTVTDRPLKNIKTLYYNARQVPYVLEGTFLMGSVGGVCQVVIGETVENIPQYFLYKNRVTSVVMSPSVTSIGKYAFCDIRSLSTITIPKNVTSIGDYAFGHNPYAGTDYSGSPAACGFTTIISEMTTPPAINATVFNNPENMTLYIPAGTTNNYASADYWKLFGHIIENTPIDFEDLNVKDICVEKWDTNGNGELELTGAHSVQRADRRRYAGQRHRFGSCLQREEPDYEVQ